MDRLTLIEDFRKLEEALGKESSALLIKILDRREEMLLDKLATKEDLAHLEKRVEAKIGSMAWKMAGLLILQAGVIVALLKLI